MTRKHMTCWSILAAALLTAAGGTASEIKESELIPAVETWVRHVTADAQADATVDGIEAYKVDGATAAYIVTLKPAGFCICGADDRSAPVTLYSAVGKFDGDNPDYQYMLDDISQRLNKIKTAERQQDRSLDQYREALNARRAYWADLKARRVPAVAEEADGRGIPSYVALPLTSRWRQGSPYNDQCPNLTPGQDEHAVTGCVATASAQIMYYWQWPPSGEGSGSTDYNYRYTTSWLYEPLATDPGLSSSWTGRLEWVSTGGGQLRMNGYWDGSIYGSADNVSEDPAYLAALEDLWNRMSTGTTTCSVNFGSQSYNWSMTKDEHADPAGTDDAEVAKICYHAGVALGMNYGAWSSGSHTMYASSQLPAHFQFDGDATYSGTNIAVMRESIAWFRPVQIGGQNPGGGGHSWVACGYNTTPEPDQFLMNLGHGNGSTEWYSVDEVYPDDQGHTTNLAPESVVRFVGEGFLFADGSPDNPYMNLETAWMLVPDGTTLVFKAGSTHTLSGDPVVLDTPMTYKGYDVTIEAEP